MAYKPTIGIEVHAELNTKTKMFCNSPNNAEEKEPNINICPVCIGHPGTLPVINKEAVRAVLRVGLAVGGASASYTEFDRKNYFYPDLPKGYQISQYKYPLVSGGELAGVKLTRIHLEEDTARSFHKGGESFLDFNRAGLPLMELVTEPVVGSIEEAQTFAKELQLLLRTLGVSHANMDKGQMRVEANISLSKDPKKLGTKVEVKNLNSFKILGGAIAYEMKRQQELLEKGEEIVQETRGWDEDKGKTFAQRLKEESHDYRYFPEPDLPFLNISEIPEFSKEALNKDMPELPSVKREKYKNLNQKTRLNEDYIELFVSDRRYGDLFDGAYTLEPTLYNLIASSIGTIIAGLVSKHGDEGLGNITPKNLAEVNGMFFKNVISSSARDQVLTHMFLHGGNPQEIAEEKKLLQMSDEGALEEIIKKVIADNPSVVEEYRAGKEVSIQFLVGQGMKESKGSADPKRLRSLLEESLKK